MYGNRAWALTRSTTRPVWSVVFVAEGDLDQVAYGEVGNRSYSIAQHDVPGDALQPAHLLVAYAVHEHGVDIEARTVHRGKELEVEVGLPGGLGQRQFTAHRAAHLDERDAVPGECGPYDEAVAFHGDLAELLPAAGGARGRR